MKTIVIIGGWPAGLMTAASLLESENKNNFKIILLEWNAKLGRKLVISGGGRCNVTTGIFDKKILETKYTRGFDFFKNFLWKFWPKKCKKWLEENSLPLKIEDDLRVFPTSDNGDDVLWVFEKIFAKNTQNIEVKTGEKVTEIYKITENQFQIITQKSEYKADFLVIATGGNAYAHTGSKGDGYNFARNLGHTITKLWPSLSSFLVKEDWVKELSGTTFPKAKIIFDNKNISGSLLLTHFGISGPLAFMLSSHLAWENISEKIINFVPNNEISADDWDNFFKNEFAKFPKRKIFAILKEILPNKFSEIFIKNFCKNIEEKFVGEISKKDRENIAKLLGNGIAITLLERRPWDEFVTAGGVNTDEINSETLESTICENLYFAWEILNIDGYTGGFSLQICWSTGYQVGKSIEEKIN